MAWTPNFVASHTQRNGCGWALPYQRELKGTHRNGHFSQFFRRCSLIFVASPGIYSIWEARFSQNAAGNRRFSQKATGSHRFSFQSVPCSSSLPLEFHAPATGLRKPKSQKCRAECWEECRATGDCCGDCREQCRFSAFPKKPPSQHSSQQSPFPGTLPSTLPSTFGDLGFLSPVQVPGIKTFISCYRTPGPVTDLKVPGSLTHHRCRHLLEEFSKGS